MSYIVSGIATRRATGPGESFVGFWMGAWSFSWAVAFPAVLVIAPFTRCLVARLTRAD